MGGGEAVAVGMIAEAELGIRLGITEKSTADTLKKANEALRLPTELARNVDFDVCFAAMAKDKKARSGEIRFTLLERIGQVHRDSTGDWTSSVSKEEIFRLLKCLT